MLKRLRALSVDTIIRQTITVVIFIVLCVFILINYDTLLGQLADTLGITGAIMAFYFSFVNFLNDRFEKKRLSERISICLHNIVSKETYTLPFTLRRGNFSRAELLGYLGMIPKRAKKQRFDIQWLSTRAFFNALESIQAGEGDSITIHCTATEFNQFDFDAAAALDTPNPSLSVAPANTEPTNTEEIPT